MWAHISQAVPTPISSLKSTTRGLLILRTILIAGGRGRLRPSLSTLQRKASKHSHPFCMIFTRTILLRPVYATVVTPTVVTAQGPGIIYAAEPGFFTQIQPGSGKFLPGFAGWDRGSNYFDKWLKRPVHLGNQVHWSTSGQHVGPYQPGGADPNKFTQKYSKRSADSESQYYVRYTNLIWAFGEARLKVFYSLVSLSASSTTPRPAPRPTTP